MKDYKPAFLGDSLHELLSIIGIGTWDWNLSTGEVIYSQAWAAILGYNAGELAPVVGTWEKMVLPEDLMYANEQIDGYLTGKKPTYEAEFRMVCKDGSVIWAQDKGKVIEYDEEGRPIRFVGVLQSVSRLKDAEFRLRENQETLDLAVNVAELGTWDWDIPGDCIHYNDEYLRMLGYAQSDMNGSMEEWESMNHPEDLPRSMKLLEAYLAGEIPAYECEIRMKHRDGQYLWTRDVGKIVARDAEGNPTRLIGGHLNIDALKGSERELKQALAELEHNKRYLENEVEIRTKELVEQDKLLWTVNQISRKLLTFQSNDDFDGLVQDCLRLLGESINKNRVYIWKDRAIEGVVYCTQIYEWVEGVISIQDNEDFAEIPYRDLPSFANAIDSNQCLNSRICDLAQSERDILEPQGIRTILIAPIAINGNRWGFIGVDNCESEQYFSPVEENMLFMSGSMLASTIEKMETEAKMREMEERTQIMLNATPLCCNLWTPDLCNMNCNDEAVRLFELSSQQEYLERFHELSPEFQPCGRASGELAAEYIKKAFEEGYYRFEWLHQKIDGTPIPAEITLVRIRYKSGFIVAGYTRDLREHKAMLAELGRKEDDLRNARDEALLSSKAKSNFLANMSHEIRTPMNAISGLAEIILRENPDGKSAEYAKSIKGACDNLLNIINDILDISKIESGKLEIIRSQYELASLLNDVITIARMRLGDKPLMLVTNIDSRLPAFLMGDEIRIKQILINFLSNAIKFTESGHITLRVWGEIDGGHCQLHFSVADTGSGIKSEDLDRLFAEFERVNTTKNRSIEGTGLGLAISKQLCEMMEGSIEVESTYGVGSVFTAHIPQECPEYERIARVENEKTVLLYEPRDLYRKSIAESIENLDCKCVSCANQSELYDNLRAASYDQILTASLQLQKVRSIVAKNKLEVPVAVFTDYGESLPDEKTYTLLFPVNCLQLADLMNGQRNDGSFSQYHASNIDFIAPTARILVVDDSPVNLSVAEGLMAPYQFTIDTAVNGLEAVKMVQKTDYDLVFMDHMMPEMDGIDATIAIRQMDGERYRSLPIVALTANALVGTREMFLQEGMNDFLAKPIEINKLGHILHRWLPPSKIVRQEEGTASKSLAELPPWSIPGIDVAKGLQSLGGNREHYRQILSIYYTDGRKKLLSLLEQMHQQDWAAFRVDVHALKSTSATIGAKALSADAAELEAAAQQENAPFILGRLDAFLTDLNVILEGIEPVVQNDSGAKVPEAQRTKGELHLLERALPTLQDAAEFANIAQIEETMGELESFDWSDEIVGQLQAIREKLALFDYDGVLECVTHLQED